MHEKGLPGHKRPMLEHVGEHCKDSFRHAGALGEIETLGQGKSVSCVDDGELRIPAAAKQRHDLIAQAPTTDARPKRRNLPRDFKTQRRRGAGRWWVEAQPLKDVRSIDTRRPDPNEYFALPGRWRWKRGELQCLGSSLSASNGDCGHGCR